MHKQLKITLIINSVPLIMSDYTCIVKLTLIFVSNYLGLVVKPHSCISSYPLLTKSKDPMWGPCNPCQVHPLGGRWGISSCCGMVQIRTHETTGSPMAGDRIRAGPPSLQGIQIWRSHAITLFTDINMLLIS